MGESEDPIYRIICCQNENFSLTIRGGKVVFALINPLDRYQYWIKDEKHGATIKDSEGQPAFAVVNRATGQAVGHCPAAQPSEDAIYRIICEQKYSDRNFALTIRGGKVVFALINPFDRYQYWIKDEKHGATGQAVEFSRSRLAIKVSEGQPVPLVPYNMNSCGESVLWTMSEDEYYKEFWNIRRADLISDIWAAAAPDYYILDGRIMYLATINSHNYVHRMFLWKFEKVSPSSCITIFRPSQHTVKIICYGKVGYNLAIDKDGSTVLLVPANPKDKYQHWIQEMAYDVPVKNDWGRKAFALVNKATGKAIKHGFGHNYLVQVAPFNQNYMDHSLLWTYCYYYDGGFHQITPQNNTNLAFNIFDEGLGNSPLLGLSKIEEAYRSWKIEDFE